MTSNDLRRTQTYRALIACIVRYLRAQREDSLDRGKAKGWDWEKTQQEHRDLERVDEALTRLGIFGTDANNIRRPQRSRTQPRVPTCSNTLPAPCLMPKYER